MDYKEEIKKLKEQVENIDWVMRWILDRVQENRAGFEYEPIVEALVGLNNSRSEIEGLIEEKEFKARRAGQD